MITVGRSKRLLVQTDGMSKITKFARHEPHDAITGG
jgi:hypothetical protein